MKRIRVSDLAERDLDDNWHYIATKSSSIEIANGVVDGITETFPLFAQAPEAGMRRDEIEVGLRSFPVANYIIYYYQADRFVVISRVIHGMRDQKTAFLTQSVCISPNQMVWAGAMRPEGALA